MLKTSKFALIKEKLSLNKMCKNCLQKDDIFFKNFSTDNSSHFNKKMWIIFLLGINIRTDIPDF